ncbi:MAG TPA: gluconate 2-dehydrogenase subunit 3 family protein [Bryobacteraceae bacterium]|nr:gluconate 2-dehydrogenase subunit 3 family protein [Bryobacteraceae bacterium]
MSDSAKFTTTRRAALRQLAGSATAAATVLPVLGQNPPPESHHSGQPVTKPAAAYKYRYFKPEQLATLDELGETIIPTDDHSPGAKAARVSEYIDAIVADATPATKALWNDGLAAVERAAEQRFHRSYASCSPEEQTAILKSFAVNQHAPVSLEEKFFKALKRATIDGYYTSAIGIHADLQYQGNQAMTGFPGCRHMPEGEGHSS